MPIDITPTLQDVAALERARTYVGGVDQGTFTADTRPTADQVGRLITFAVNDVFNAVGSDLTVEHQEPARNLAALRTAILIEADESEELGGTRNAASVYTAMYLQGIETLAGAVRGNTPNQPRIFSIPLLGASRYGSGCGLLDPFNTELLP